MPQTSQIKFIDDLINIVPDLRTLLAEHRADNAGELLFHVFLGEVVSWLINIYITHENDRDVLHLIKDVIDYVEFAFVRGDDATQELIAVSFVENLPSTGEPGASLRQFLGPKLEEQYRRLNW